MNCLRFVAELPIFNTAPRASKRRLESVDELLETDAAGREVPGSGFSAKKRACACAVENVNAVQISTSRQR